MTISRCDIAGHSDTITRVRASTRKRLTAWACFCTLLFLQLAVAAHACTLLGSSQAEHAAAMADNTPCHGEDQELAKLCEQHCLQSSQSVDSQPHTSQPAPVSTLIVTLVRVDAPVLQKRHPPHERVAAVVDPPPLVRFGVLRI